MKPVPLSHPNAFMITGGQDQALVINPDSDHSQIIATSPIVKQDESTPTMRVVLRLMTDNTFAVHFQIFPWLKRVDDFVPSPSKGYSLGDSYFHEGSYCQKDFALAMTRFAERCMRFASHCAHLGRGIAEQQSV